MSFLSNKPVHLITLSTHLHAVIRINLRVMITWLMSPSRCSLCPIIIFTDIISINIIIRSRCTMSSPRTTGRAEVPLMRWDHILEGAAFSLPVAKKSLIVFCPICELLLTTIHLPHFLCQFPKLKKYHVVIYSATPHFQRRLPASPWQLPISKDGGVCRPCVWREALRGAGGAHMEQWPGKKKKKKRNTLPASMCQQCPF